MKSSSGVFRGSPPPLRNKNPASPKDPESFVRGSRPNFAKNEKGAAFCVGPGGPGGPDC
jgi:hypothetical protein